MTKHPDPNSWYAEGVRFECLPDCGACCTNHDDHAYVYLEGNDLERLAALLELTPAEFQQAYTTVDDGFVVLRMDDPACPFLDGSRCSVYPARPRQCRRFPFWEENLSSPAAWRRVGNFCPGIGRGPVHTLLTIRDRLAEEDEA